MVFIICCVLLLIYLLYPRTEKMTLSEIDGQHYPVKAHFEDYKMASDTLAKLNKVNNRLINHLQKKYKDTPYYGEVEFLSGNYDGGALSEHTPKTTVNTSYVLNKGDQIKLCLRSPKNGKIHDFQTLLFVNLHELSHLLDRQYGHNDTFWDSFKILLHEARSIGVYNPIDYEKYPTTYCGITIASNPYYD